MLVRSSTLAVHGVLPLGLSLYTKRHEMMVTARVSLIDYWMDSFVGSAAELERKTPAPYSWDPLSSAVAYVKLKILLHAFLDEHVFVGMSADWSGLCNLTISTFFNTSKSTRVQVCLVCLASLADSKLASNYEAALVSNENWQPEKRLIMTGLLALTWSYECSGRINPANPF